MRAALLRVEIFAVQNVFQVLAVFVLFHHFIGLQYFFSGDPSVQIADFFQTADLAVLMLFNGFDKIRGVHQTFVSSGVKPCESLSQKLNTKIPVLQIDPVQIRYLVLSALGRLQALGILNNPVVVKLQTGHAVVPLGMFVFLVY